MFERFDEISDFVEKVEINKIDSTENRLDCKLKKKLIKFPQRISS